MRMTREQVVIQLRRELFSPQTQDYSSNLGVVCEQMTEISTDSSNREFLPVGTNQDSSCNRCTVPTDVTTSEAKHIVALGRSP